MSSRSVAFVFFEKEVLIALRVRSKNVVVNLFPDAVALASSPKDRNATLL